MTDHLDPGLEGRWEAAWRGLESGGRGLTFLGKRMFQAKRRLLSSGLLSELGSELGEVKTVLEVGCGGGEILEVYQRLGLDARGIDLSPSAVRLTRARGLRAERRDVRDETGLYDLVSSDGMLEHFIHYEPMAAEMMRLSRRYVLLIQPNHGSFWGKVLPCLAELIQGEANMLEYNYRIADFIDTFAGHGFPVRRNLPLFADVFRLLVFERAHAPAASPSAERKG